MDNRQNQTDLDKTQVKDVELPFFCGFYESPFENYYLIDEAITDTMDRDNERGLNTVYDDYEFDYKTYRGIIVNSFIKAIKEHLPGWIENVSEPELWSPNFYNFQTDKIYATLTLANDWKEKLSDFFDKNKETLRERIKKDYSSRSGFNSFIETDYDTFVENTLSGESRYLGIIMQYAIELNEDEDADNLYEYITEETFSYFYDNYRFDDFIHIDGKQD